MKRGGTLWLLVRVDAGQGRGLMAKKKKTTRKATRKKAGGRKKRAQSMGKKRGRAAGSLRSISTTALAAELARRESRLDELQQERQQLATRLAEIDATLSEIGAVTGHRIMAIGSGRRRPRNKMNLADSLAGVLKGRQLTVTELAEEVQRAGYRTSSPNFRTIVNQTLIKDPKRFKKVSRGVYTVE